MLDLNNLSLTLDLHRRSYRLLLWLSDHAGRNSDLNRVLHDSGRVEDAAFEWFDRLYVSLPTDTRPERQFLKQYASFFSTYLATSFEHNPRQIRTVSACGCYCTYCSYVVSASALKQRKATARDRKRATRLMEDRIVELAYEQGVASPDTRLDDLLADENIHRAAAWSTYGAWLIRRCKGVSAGPSLLVLWRRIKSDPERTYPHSQGLQLQNFVEAEEQLSLAIGESERST